MKKILLLMILLALPLVSAGLDDLNVNVVDIPSSVTPGTIFNVQFRVENVGVSDLNNVDFTLEEDSPFEVDNNEVSFNSIPAGTSVLLNFNVQVDEDANSGFEELELTYESGSDDDSKIFNVNVQAIETTLIVTSVESDPSKIEPGSEAEVKIRIKNKASVSLRDVTVKLDLSGDIPFAPLTSVTEQRVNSLKKNQETELVYKIIALAEAEPKIYKIPLLLNYFDEQGNQYVKTDVIALIVDAEPVLDFLIEESKLVEGKNSMVSVKIVNRGLSNVKFLNFELQSGNFEIISTKSVYVGNLDSDDYEIVDFEIKPRGSMQLPLTVTYKDANNKDFVKNVFLSPKVHSIQEAKQVGLVKTSKVLYITPIVLLVLIWFAYRRLRKK